MWYIYAAAAAKSHQLCPTLCDPIDSSPPGSHPWDSPGKNAGVDCHFLLQCMKVKSEREVAQSCPTLRDPMDCNLPGCSVRGISQARVLEWVANAFSVHICNGLLLSQKKPHICMCVCVYMDIHTVLLSYRKEWSNVFCNNMDGPIITLSEINTPSEVSQTKTNIWHCSYVESKKRDKHAFIFKT